MRAKDADDAAIFSSMGEDEFACAGRKNSSLNISRRVNN